MAINEGIQEIKNKVDKLDYVINKIGFLEDDLQEKSKGIKDIIERKDTYNGK